MTDTNGEMVKYSDKELRTFIDNAETMIDELQSEIEDIQEDMQAFQTELLRRYRASTVTTNEAAP